MWAEFLANVRRRLHEWTADDVVGDALLDAIGAIAWRPARRQ